MANAQNINQRVEGNKLIIEVDLNQNFGPSSTGKTDVVASSGGFQKIMGDISFSMNVCKKRPK